ncbi:MAG: hypothetical protein HY689_02545 [Chloroflexi bacterium]|nr:hypothetical protein [Chloroflexota bacterium]
MAILTALEHYRHYLETIDRQASEVPPDEYEDLLSPGEVDDICIIRDELAAAQFSEEEQQELARLDGLLLKHWRIIATNLLDYRDKSRAHWWWHLDEGPQVREQARGVA